MAARGPYCPRCGCLNDDHFNPTESDDSVIMASVAAGETPLNCCGNCTECDFGEYQSRMRPTIGPWLRIGSPRHPGATFFKRARSANDFICKVYTRHDVDANLIEGALGLLEAAEDFLKNEDEVSPTQEEYDTTFSVVTKKIRDAVKAAGQ